MPKFSVGESFTVAFISGIEQVWIRGGGGVSRFSMEKFLSHSAENLCRESFIVALISGTGEVCRRWGEYQDFPSKIFLSHNAQNFRRGILYCCINFGYRKSFDKRGGGEYRDFLSKSFCLTVPKISVGLSFIVALVSGTGKVCRRRGEYQGFLSKIFCLTVPKISVGESLTVALVSGIEKVWIRGGGGSIKIFYRKVFVSQCRKSL